MLGSSYIISIFFISDLLLDVIKGPFTYLILTQFCKLLNAMIFYDDIGYIIAVIAYFLYIMYDICVNHCKFR